MALASSSDPAAATAEPTAAPSNPACPREPHNALPSPSSSASSFHNLAPLEESSLLSISTAPATLDTALAQSADILLQSPTEAELKAAAAVDGAFLDRHDALFGADLSMSNYLYPDANAPPEDFNAWGITDLSTPPACNSSSESGVESGYFTLTEDSPDFHSPYETTEVWTPASCCMAPALALVQRQCSHSAAPSGRVAFQKMLAENRQTIMSVKRILQCRCSQDAYLLPVMSLIIARLLATYSWAAENPAVSSRGTVNQSWLADGHMGDGHDCSTSASSDRADALAVLGELHHIQDILRMLSQRFKTDGASSQHHSQPSFSPPLSAFDSSSSITGSLRSEAAMPFSNNTLASIEADLGRRLQSLSMGLIGALRREPFDAFMLS